MLHVFVPDIPITEKVLRSVFVYLFCSWRSASPASAEVGQLTPFDLIVLLNHLDVVQNALIGNYNSLGGRPRGRGGDPWR